MQNRIILRIPHQGLFVAVSSVSFLIPPTAYPARCGLLTITLLVILTQSQWLFILTPKIWDSDTFCSRQCSCLTAFSRCWSTFLSRFFGRLLLIQLDWLPLPPGSLVASSLSSSPSSSMLSFSSTSGVPAKLASLKSPPLTTRNPTQPQETPRFQLTLTYFFFLFIWLVLDCLSWPTALCTLYSFKMCFDQFSLSLFLGWHVLEFGSMYLQMNKNIYWSPDL